MGDVCVWKCGQGHVMGLVVRNGRRVQRLLLYRHALDYNPTPSPSPSPKPDGEGSQSETPEVMAVVEGTVMDVRCSVCGGVRTWAVRKGN
jgi:hypothetical protein